MEVQIFGTRGDAATRKALRFFSERRVRTHFMDLAQRGPAPRELQRFARRFGVDALIDREGKRFRALGLGAAHYTEARWLEKLVEEPKLLRTPLVRWKERLTIGEAEAEWKSWLSS